MSRRYDIIYADPPWSYQDRNCNGAAAQQYPTMKIADLMALPVRDLASDDAVLFMWATYPLLEHALQLIPAWGFTYKSIAFQWVKTYAKSGQYFFGLGRWTRGNTEPCLLATRGKPRPISKSVSQLVVSPIGRHSAKPLVVRDKIVQLMGDRSRVELFSRNKGGGGLGSLGERGRVGPDARYRAGAGA